MLNYRYASDKAHRITPGELEWRLIAEHSGGGLFLDLGSHALDISDFLFGPIEQVHGAAAIWPRPATWKTWWLCIAVSPPACWALPAGTSPPQPPKT